MSAREGFENPKHNPLVKTDDLVKKKLQMNFYFIGTKSINNWINRHISITKFTRQTIT